MNNLLLGKTLKAMYKLSGKTLNQLADESGLTVDTVNNLFYARIQKPGLIGVCALVKAMGFQAQDLISFMEQHADLPETADVTELFTEYIHTVRDTAAIVPHAEPPVRDTAPSASNASNAPQPTAAVQTFYWEQMEAQHREQIEQLRESERHMEQHYDHSIEELKKLYAAQTARQDEELRRREKNNRILSIALAVETLLLLCLTLFDVLNANIGWIR